MIKVDNIISTGATGFIEKYAIEPPYLEGRANRCASIALGSRGADTLTER
jgi:hypothetical protein